MGPVDRVDVPADRRALALGPVLLADDPVLREFRGDPGPDHPLDRLVGDRHEGPVRLALEVQVAPEVRERDRVCTMSGIFGQHCWIDIPNRVVIARFSSYPTALPEPLYYETLDAFRAISDALRLPYGV